MYVLTLCKLIMVLLNKGFYSIHCERPYLSKRDKVIWLELAEGLSTTEVAHFALFRRIREDLE